MKNEIIFCSIRQTNNNRELNKYCLNLIAESSLMSQRRQLAVVLFTDVEGYNAITQQSEQKAIVLKDRHRQILQKEHKQFDGRII